MCLASLYLSNHLGYVAKICAFSIFHTVYRLDTPNLYKKIYCTCRIYKNNRSLRTIVSRISTITYQCDRYLTVFLSVGKIIYHTRNLN